MQAKAQADRADAMFAEGTEGIEVTVDALPSSDLVDASSPYFTEWSETPQNDEVGGLRSAGEAGEITLAPVVMPVDGVINLTDAISFDESMRGMTINVPLDITNVQDDPRISAKWIWISECADVLARLGIILAIGFFQNGSTWNNFGSLWWEWPYVIIGAWSGSVFNGTETIRLTKNLAPANPSVSGNVNGQVVGVDNRDALPGSFETDGLNLEFSNYARLWLVIDWQLYNNERLTMWSDGKYRINFTLENFPILWDGFHAIQFYSTDSGWYSEWSQAKNVKLVSAEAAQPIITTQPQSQTLEEWQTLTLSIGADHAQSYQWYKDGVAIWWATGNTYTKANVIIADGGTYKVDAINGAKTTTSNNAVVTVSEAPDTEKPVITLQGGSTITLTVGDTYIEPGVSITDNKDSEAELQARLQITGWNYDTSAPGTYYLFYNVSDAAGNAADPKTRTVIVAEAPDTTPPVITVLGDNPATVTQGETYIDAGATARDDRDGDITHKIQTVGTVDTQTVGSYTITYTVSDAAGNAASATRTVIVEKGNGMEKLSVLPFTLYPNPATSHVRITGETPILHLKILNLQGALVLQTGGSGSAEMELLVFQLPAGIYIVHVFFENSFAVGKFIKE